MERQEQIGFKLPPAYIEELTKRGEELGLSKLQSSRYQLVATPPDEAFEELVRNANESGVELTTTAALKLARQFQKKRPKSRRRNQRRENMDPATAVAVEIQETAELIGNFFDAPGAQHLRNMRLLSRLIGEMRALLDRLENMQGVKAG